jgi:hypothetical protein
MTSRSQRCVVAIHQPNFFPWLGYFDKILRSDIFVVLDSVQFPKKQGNWMNRVRILEQGEARWLTLPVDRAYHGLRRVNEMKISQESSWEEKTMRTLHHAYGKSPHFDEVLPTVEPLVRQPEPMVADYNLKAIRTLTTRLLSRPAQFVRSSTLNVEGSATDLLVDIVKSVGGNSYLRGGGAIGYQEDVRFGDEGIELVYQRFEPPSYPQTGAATPVTGLSVMDALFNVGFDETANLLERAPERPHRAGRCT